MDLKLLNSSENKESDIKIKNFIISGPNGIGKTCFAKAYCNEVEIDYKVISCIDFLNLSGNLEDVLKKYFEFAEKCEPCCLIFDKLDYFLTKKESSLNTRFIHKLVSLINEKKFTEVYTILLVNKSENIVKELKTFNNYEKEIEIKIPNENDRFEILKKWVDNNFKDKNLITHMVNKTSGYIADDLKSLIKQSKINRYIRNLKEKSTTKNYVILADINKSLREILPSMKKVGFSSIPKTSFEDIGALEEIKKRLEVMIFKPLENKEQCEKFNLKQKAGILLYGPPGCGKTMLAKAIANKSKSNFISIKGPELLSKYVGDSEKAVRSLFQRARECSPCLIFFDEFDAMCPKRQEGGNQVTERVVNQMLTELNGIDNLEQIFVIAATNRPDIIDKAVIRNERIGEHIYVGIPNKLERYWILKTILSKKPIHKNFDIKIFSNSNKLNNFTGADLYALIEEASRNAAWNIQEKDYIEEEDFLKALNTIKPNLKDEDIIYYENLKKLFD